MTEEFNSSVCPARSRFEYDREEVNAFVRNAESILGSTRRGLLIFTQAGEMADLATAFAGIVRLRKEAVEFDSKASLRIVELCNVLLSFENNGTPLTATSANQVLDLIAEIEAAIHDISFGSAETFPDIDELVDETFNRFSKAADRPKPNCEQERSFDVDDETWEIFRSEADTLAGNIGYALNSLEANPTDQKAIWEIRRNIHTLKGSAGIVGLKRISEAAHAIEDLLDRIVEDRSEASSEVISFLTTSLSFITMSLADGGEGKALGDDSLTDLLNAAVTSVHPDPDVDRSFDKEAETTEAKVSPRSPIVRVSISRLDALTDLSDQVLDNTASIFEKARLAIGDHTFSTSIQEMAKRQLELTTRLRNMLFRIRMVNFGTLETRLKRAVNVTAFDEGKKAAVEFRNPHVEIDTCIIDALMEPLLHLLKNAVVHGIETPETRRLLGKPETGSVVISVDVDDSTLVLTVADDGAGISIPKLKEKIAETGLSDARDIDAMSDRNILKSIFERGLTTSNKIDLNSGRGVGMSIAKEGIESLGGKIFVETRPHEGTTFTIVVPLPQPESVQQPLVETGRDDTLADKDRSPLVLIVEDSASIMNHLTKIIEAEGCRFITAQNGADALEILLNDTIEPDLIFSDIEMPQIDGWSLLEYVKTDDNFGHIPVVLISSLNSEEDRGRAFALGASDMLSKPFEAGEIKRFIDKFCRTVPA